MVLQIQMACWVQDDQDQDRTQQVVEEGTTLIFI